MPIAASGGCFALLVAAIALAGCSFGSDDPPDPDADGESAPPTATASRDVVVSIDEALDERAAAVRRADGSAFLAGLVPDDRTFRREQSAYFSNLLQLPVGSFGYRFDPASVVREGDSYWVTVELRMRLDGYDDRAVVSRDRFRFSPGAGTNRMLLASTSDLAWEAEHQVQPDPWESGEVVVRTLPGVLGIFDEDSVDAARTLLSSARRGMDDVAGVVPYAWSRSVVVYALSDSGFLDALPRLPGRDPGSVDAVAFPVFAGRDSDRPAATRIAFHPRMLAEPGSARNRLMRHELTHAAVGQADDNAPLWLSEGIAEYVSVQPLAPERRQISGRAIAAAREGFVDLPPDDGFTAEESVVAYALSWFACEYLASSYGDLILWSLLDQYDRADLDPDEVLQAYTGLNSRQLARKAGKLLLATYEPPEPEPTPSPVRRWEINHPMAENG